MARRWHRAPGHERSLARGVRSAAGIALVISCVVTAGAAAEQAPPAPPTPAPGEPRTAPATRPRAPSSAPATRPVGPSSQPTAAATPRARGATAEPPAPAAAATEPQHPDAPGLDRTGSPPLPRSDSLPPQSAPPGVERPVPDLDGREDPPASAGELLIWIPRAILFPLHVLMEYGIRQPVVGLGTLIEKHELHRRVQRLFVFRDGRAGLFPTFLYEFGTYASLGAYFYHDDLFRPGHRLVLHGGFWTGDWLRLELNDELLVFREDTGLVTTNFLYERRPDRPFHGIGPDTSQAAETFFRIDLFQARTSLAGHLGPLDEARLTLAYRRARFSDGMDPQISQLFATDAVPGFAGYHVISTGIELALDTREPNRLHTSGTGGRLELFGSFNVDPANPELRFVRWGGEGALFLDVTGHNNVLGIRCYVELAEPLDSAELPFYELPALGGDERMRGFLEGRFRGPSVFLLTAEYRYPIWSLADASVFVSGGNACGSYLDGLRLDHLFLSWGLGLRSNVARDVSFDILLASGTNRVDSEDLALEHVRFVFGVTTGF